MNGQIVVGVDGSEGGRHALEWAVRQAAASGARLLVASVYFDPAHRRDHTPPARAHWARQDAERQIKEDLEAVLAKVPVRPEIETRAVPGDLAAQALADLAEDADLLVVGSHGHPAVTRLLLGTVSMGCAARAVCPVVVIPAAGPAKHHARAHGPFASINPIPYY